MIDIKANIEAVRKERLIGQKEIADKLNITPQAYSNWMTRSADLPFDRITQICEVMGVSLIDVITYPEKYVPSSEQKECEECKKKQRTIDNLNKYIELIESRKK